MNIGADPEFFLIGADGRPKGAWKHWPCADEGKMEVAGQGKMFRDGYALELNPNPSYCRQLFGTTQWHLLRKAKELLSPGESLALTQAVRIDMKEFLDEAPPDCQEFGCKPSLNAYIDPSLPPVLPDIDALTHPYRYAGGHMHFSCPREVTGYEDEVDEDGYRTRTPDAWGEGMAPWALEKNIPMAVKLFDLFIMIPWIAQGCEGKEAVLRRRHYGRAGEYRVGQYGEDATGFEYRTPGPEMWKSPYLYSFFFGMGKTVLLNFEKLAASWDPDYEPIIKDAINKGDRDVARLLMQETVFAPIAALPLLRKVLGEKKQWVDDAFSGPARGQHPLGWGDLLRANGHNLVKGVSVDEHGRFGKYNGLDARVVGQALNAWNRSAAIIQKVHWPSMTHLRAALGEEERLAA